MLRNCRPRTPIAVLMLLGMATASLTLAARSTPAGAEIVSGCTIVSNPTPTSHTNCPGADLNSADLAHLDLSYANLAGAHLNGATLKYSNLTNANLSHAGLNRASLFEAVVAGLNLNNATLTHANLKHLDDQAARTPATLQHADMSGASLDGALIAGSDLMGATLSSGSLVGTDLDFAILTNVSFQNAIVYAHLGHANLAGANFTGATLAHSLFQGTLLVPADQSVTTSNPNGAPVTWPPPSSLPGATPGSCRDSRGTVISGSTFKVGKTFVVCQVQGGTPPTGNTGLGFFTVTVTLTGS